MTVGLDSFVLVSVPLFIFAGELMNVCGVTQRLVRVAAVIVGHMHGGLANVGVVANFLMSGISGSSVADAAATGTVLVPEMKRRGFPEEFACAVIACASTVGPIIPPSIVFLLLASIVNLSVGQLFLAGVVPGILMSTAMFIVTWRVCKKRNYPREGRAPAAVKASALKDAALALVAPAVIVGSIVGGIATPTESAALGAAAALAAAAGYRRLGWKSFVVSVRETLRFTVMTLFIIAGSITFSQIMAFTQASDGLSGLISGAGLSPLMVLLGMLGILLFLGCFMDQVSMMMITSPLFMPIAEQLGFDVVWFGVLMLMILEISLATPPFGLLLFVAKGAAPDTSMREIIVSVAPFIAIALGVVVLLIAFPELTLVLPRLMAP
jgi:tripartite ATP-independent transporter DctM subunit